MSQRNTKMMMLLAQKNKALREKFKESKQLQRNIKTIDPDFFPTSDSDDDPAFSRFNSADQLLAPILPSSNGFDFEDSHFLSGPCTSNVDYFAMHQDDQNTEIGNNNKSPNSLITLTTVPIIEHNDLSDISSPGFCFNTHNIHNVFNCGNPEPLITDTIEDQQRSCIFQDDTEKILITASDNTICTSESLRNNSNVISVQYEKSVENSSQGHEVTPNDNLRDTENLTQNEIADGNTHNLTTYTKAGTIRKRKKHDQPLKVRNEVKKSEIREKHNVKPPCPASCKKQCIQNISEEQRKIINESFWSLNDKERKAYMLHHTSAKSVKQRTVTRFESEEYRKKVSYSYSLKDVLGTKYGVCKTFFLTTLGYKSSNDKTLHTALANSNDTVAPPVDKRLGATPHNKIESTPINEHIMSFEPSISHYRREHAPNRLYLPSDLTISAMHKDFLEKNPSCKVSYDKYREVVAELNISFVKLGHEECEDCEEFRLHDDTHTKENLKEDCLGCTKWKSHNKRAYMSREQYKLDSELNETDTVVYSADLQKVIMLPRIDMFKTAIFTHRIVVYNESFVPTGQVRKDLSVFPVLWYEGLFGRSKAEIISAYYQFFIFHRDKKNIILWVDNCSSQNKNWTFFSFLIYIINSKDINADKIVIKYFESGHTFMSADSFHHRVELSIKRMKNKIYDFADFSQAVSTAGKNVKLKEMNMQDFYDWDDYTTQYALSRIKPRPYVSEMVEVEVKRGSFDITYKTGFDQNAITASIIGKKILKSHVLPPPKKKTAPEGISRNKKENILKSFQNIIPQNRMSFWRELPTFDY